LLADYFLRLAAFAAPARSPASRRRRWRPVPDADFFSLRVTWQFSKGGSVQETVRIRPGARVPLQPICDALNHGLALRREDRRKKGPRLQAYLCASSPWGHHVVLATAAEAARLRRHAYLIEPEPSVADTERLGDAGFELPYLGGYWHNWGSWIAAWPGRASSPAGGSRSRSPPPGRATAPSSSATRPEGDGRLPIREVTGKEEVVEVLPRVYRDLNTFLAAQGSHTPRHADGGAALVHAAGAAARPEAVAAIRNAPGA
jgi:hypothetical protein